MKKATKPLVIRAKRSSFVLVCGKCVRKCDDGAPIRKSLKGELRARAQAAGRRPDKLVETKCMGLCPKNAVVVGNGAMLAGGELLILRRVEDVAETADILQNRAKSLGRSNGA